MSKRINEIGQSTVLLNGKQAEDEMKKLAATADNFSKKKKEAFEKNDLTAYKKWDNELKGINRQMKNMKLEVTSVEAVLANLNGASLDDIRRAANKATAELKKMKQTDPGFKEKSAQAQVLNEKYREMNTQIRGVKTSGKGMFSGMASGFNKYFGIATAFIASITGVVIGFKELSKQAAELDDVYSDVMKTTGYTRDQVVSLNEEFKKTNTRTAREQLNLLARDAGKLGLSSREDILGFVDAGNQINVALGEDLGADAIKTVGKMVGVYKNASVELQGLDLKGQMLAVGSAINELGASSTASEPYLVQFAGRLGGIAQQAGISMSAILGYASALDQDMQQVEMSATALQNFIMKVMGDPAKFAKIAGLEVSNFSQLLKTDANAAIKQVLYSLNQKGGFQDLIPIFEEMGLDGARAVGVLSSMANSIDKVEVAQQIANKAMLEGTSITKEYDIKNNNLAAKLEKARKNMKEMGLELGEKIAPAMLLSTNSMSYMIRVLITLIKFFNEYGRAVVVLTATIVTYSIAVNAANIAFKAHYYWLVMVEKAQKLLNLTTKANPVALVAAAVAGLVTALIFLARRTNEAADAQKRLNEYMKDTDDLIQRSQSIKQRAQTIDNMSKLQLERFIADAQTELDTFRVMEDKKLLAAKAYQDEVAKLEAYVSRTAENEAERRALYNNKFVTQARDDAFANLQDVSNFVDENSTMISSSIVKAQTLLNNLNKPKVGGDGSATRAGAPLLPGMTPRAAPTGISLINPNYLKETERAFEEHKLKLMQQRADGALTQDQYNKQIENLEFAHLLTIYEMRKQLGLDTIDIERKLLDKRIKNIDEADAKQIASQQRMMQAYVEFANTGAKAIEEFIGGNEDALRQGAKAMIGMMLDLLKAQMQISIAGATMQSLATPASVGTLGLAGWAEAAILAGLIELAFAAAKGQVNSIMGGYESGGYTSGNRKQIAGVVHGNEFVGNADAVANPTVRPLFDLVNYAQENGTISSFNLNAAMAASSNMTARSMGSTTHNVSLDASMMMAVAQRFEDILEKFNREGIYTKLVYYDLKTMMDKESRAISKTK